MNDETQEFLYHVGYGRICDNVDVGCWNIAAYKYMSRSDYWILLICESCYEKYKDKYPALSASMIRL